MINRNFSNHNPYQISMSNSPEVDRLWRDEGTDISKPL